MIGALIIVLLGGLIVLGYMYFLSENDHLQEKQLPCKGLDAYQRVQLLFISDIHNRILNEATFKKINTVDIVVIGGDFVDKRTSYERFMHNLSILKQWGAPVYFVPGNNDHEWKYGSFLDDLIKEEVTPLSNEDEYVELPNGTAVVLSALDPYFMKPNRNASYLEDQNCLQILCVHDPYVFKRMNQGSKERFDMVLSGHTHGGQIRLLGFGPYERGGWQINENQSFLVSEGYGTSLLPLRLGTQAECHWIELTPKN
ncbi:metallophosphoesterase [Halobacillus litoralis]|uniref:metallophosphoesterase n=1 Tax=Halobacillus litoralis TaxID=45668 RepID=UPI001CFE9E71|nr:metallophosphoesterase [Halobacillus litoralis]WLR46722.1 metallophosphoesterase [Halobacillus litoralis]